MNLVTITAGIDKEGIAVFVGKLMGYPSETRAKWNMGFGVGKIKDRVVFIVYNGVPERPTKIFEAKEGLRLLKSMVEHGFYKAWTTVDWKPEEVTNGGWMTAFSIDPLWQERVEIPESTMDQLKSMIGMFKGSE